MLRDELANVSPAWRSVSYAFMIRTPRRTAI
jgi:hypothetical protein